MKLLLTSDWQASRHNLDLCRLSLQELLEAAHRHKPDAIINAGDLKEDYDPCSMFVVKFWVNAIKQIKDAGFRFIVLLGNHDRISQSRASKNWFEVLRAHGAETVSKPKVKEVGDGTVAFLPYTSDKDKEKQWAQELIEYARPSVLVFHTELEGAAMNSSGISGRGATPEELYMNGYKFCAGGHFHMHQTVGAHDNVMYIGSPFCQDWGEANQIKGHLLVDVQSSGKVKTTHLVTKIPHWYDMDWLITNNHVPEDGAYVRSKVAVSSKKISLQIRKQEEKIRAAFPEVKNLRLHVIHRVVAPEQLEVELSGKTDEEQIRQYVEAKLPEGIGIDAEQEVAYMAGVLSATSPRARGGRLRIVSVEATNVLSFETVRIPYGKQGLVLLKGVNKDWPGRSNGAGKSNSLSLLPIGLAGETLKGQKNDGWAREDTEEPAIVQLTLKNSRKQEVKIVRGRRPHKLLLYVDGEDVSTGLSGKGKTETQGSITEFTGFDLHMLENSVYIDQTVANGFVFGAQKARMDLVAKLLDLQRYEKALKQVTVDVLESQALIATNEKDLLRLTDKADQLTLRLGELDLVKETDWAKRLKGVRKEVDELQQTYAAFAGTQAHKEELVSEHDNLTAEYVELQKAYIKATGSERAMQIEVERAKKLIKVGKCVECGQPSKDVGQKLLARVQDEQVAFAKDAEKIKASLNTKTERLNALDVKLRKYDATEREHKNKLATSRSALFQIEQAAKDEAARNDKVTTLRKKLEDEIDGIQETVKEEKKIRRRLSKQYEIQLFAQKAFHRGGMPLYLAAGLCPLLNKAAEEYSELFTDGKMGVRFAVVDGEFAVDIVNPSGSAEAGGQSVGEAATAGLIAAFALREAAPRTNVVILDEPGHGLDPEGARMFAHGVLRLKERFETIILTTHSPIIEGLLAGEKTWTVRKRNGVSRLLGVE